VAPSRLIAVGAVAGTLVTLAGIGLSDIEPPFCHDEGGCPEENPLTREEIGWSVAAGAVVASVVWYLAYQQNRARCACQAELDAFLESSASTR
jgi:hypothetical protein